MGVSTEHTKQSKVLPASLPPAAHQVPSLLSSILGAQHPKPAVRQAK